jgi:O-acetyl-ADP-ribose deacetylase (regulator of RNase III)
MKAKVNRVTIEIVQADLLSIEAAGLVNSTDSALTLSSSLLARAGTALKTQCETIGSIEVGTAVVTSAGRLKFRRIIHAVGPRWAEGSERGKLASATWEALNLAEDNELESIVMPAISTGTLGYPLENCATTMLSQIIDFTFEKLKHLKTIIICLENDVALEIFETELQRQLNELKDTGEAKVRV